MEVLQTAEETYRRLVPESERRYPDFEHARENAAVERMDVTAKTKAEKAKSAISAPKGATSVFTVPGDGTKGANAFTEEAPQAQLLKDLGFTIAAVPDSVKGDQSMGERKDIVQLSPENVQAGLTGENWVVIAADETAKNAVTTNETFSSAAPVTGGKVQYMPPSSFRLDYYSALEMLEAVQKAYPKAS